MSETADRATKDWAGSVRAYALAWRAPSLAVFASAFLAASVRTWIWVAALIWMGTACLVNARRCGRTHCRYIGPYYLLLTLPVLLHGVGWLPLGSYAWWILGPAILFGGKIIWWATETAWGRFSTPE